MVGFRNLVLASFPGTPSFGSSRDCSVGGRSEHKEGRAWDWGVAANDPGDRAAAGEVLRWLFRAEPTGRRWAMVRRLGVMYIIYNRRIWASYRAEEGWRPYVGTSPHTDHIHFSFRRPAPPGWTQLDINQVAGPDERNWPVDGSVYTNATAKRWTGRTWTTPRRATTRS